MTKKRKRAGIITAKLPVEKFEELAAEVCILHASCKRDGYSLSKKSRLWRRADGSWTARFVYQMTTELGSPMTLTTVVRGIRAA